VRRRLVRSPYLQVVRGRNGYAAYHSLFGNLRRINRCVVELLDGFAEPRSPGEVVGPGGLGERIVDDLRRLWFLVEEGVDERDRVREWRRRREALIERGRFVTEVELCISDACNFTCSYCLADTGDALGERRRVLRSRKNKMMDLEVASTTVENLVRIARRNGLESVLVKFMGREPLLNARLMFDVLDRFGHERDGVGIRYDVTTNCSLVDDDLAERLARHDVLVNASIDIPDEANDRTRLTKSGDSTYEMVDRAIATLRRHGVRVSINSVFADPNFDRIDERLVDYAASYEIPTLGLIPVLANDHLAAHRTRSVDDIVDRLVRIYAYGRSRGVRVRGYWYNAVARLLWSRSKDFFDTVGDRNSCVATGNQIDVEPSGDVFSCRMSGAHFGHVSDFDAMLSSPVYRRYVMRTFAGDCRGCEIEGQCHGFCVGHLEGKYGDIYRVDPPYCALYAGATKRVLAII